MITSFLKNVKQSLYSLTPYGELTFFGDSEYELSKQNYRELRDWCKNLNTALIYIWIDKKNLSYKTSKVIMQLFFDLEKYQRTSKTIVQWTMNKGDSAMMQTAESFKNLFPHVTFIIKEG
jgi:hypothetical protein